LEIDIIDVEDNEEEIRRLLRYDVANSSLTNQVDREI
jgi:hypothetical protein